MNARPIRIFCSVLCGILCLSCGLSACRSGRTAPLAACKSPFRATVSGEWNGVGFSARITVSEEDRRICFSAPALLDGLELAVRDGQISLARGDVSVRMSEDALRGLLRPLTVLTELPTDPESVEKQGDQYAVSFANGVCITVSDRGAIRFVSFPEGSFRVTDFSPA